MASREDLILQVSVNGQDEIEKLSTSLRSVVAAGKGLSRQTKEMDAKQRALNKAIGLTSKGTGEYAKSLKEAIGNHKLISAEMKKVGMEAKKLSNAAKNLNGEFSTRQVRHLRTYATGLKEMERNLKQVRPRALANDFKSLSLQIKKAGKDAQFVGRSLIIGLTMPLIGFANRGLAALVAYDREFVRLNKILGDATNTVSNLEGKLFDLSSKFGVSRDLVTAVTADFAELGVTGDEVLIRLTELTNEVAILGTMDVSDSQALVQTMFLGTIRTLETMENASIKAMNAMEKQELAMKSLTNQMYVFNAVENNTALSFRDMAESLPEVTAAAVPFGISLTQAAAFLAPMKAGGIDVSVAANGLKVSLQRLVTPTGLLTKEMEKLKNKYSESAEVLDDAFDRTIGIGMSSIQGLVDATMELRKVTSDEEVLKFYSLLFQKRQSTRMLTAIDSLVAFQNEMTTGPFAPYIDQLNSIVTQMNGIHQSAIPAIKDIESFTLVTSIANSMAGETVEGFVGPLAEKDIQAARQAREAFRDYIKDVETTSADGVQIVDTITSQAGKALFVELLGAANASELAQKELEIALNSTSKAMDRLKIGMKNVAIEILSVLEGPIKKAGDLSVRVAEAFRNMPGIFKGLIVSIAAATAAIGPLVFIGGQLKLAFGVLGGVLTAFLPKMATVTAQSLITTPAMLRLKRSVQLTGDGFSTSAGRFSLFIASLASGEGKVASLANRFGLLTGVLKSTTTAGLGVEAALGSQTAMGGRGMKQLVDDAFSQSMTAMTTAASTAATTTTTAATTAATTATSAAATAATAATTAASTAASVTTAGATTAAGVTTTAAANASATMVAGAAQAAAILSAATGKPLKGVSKTASGAISGFASMGAAQTASQLVPSPAKTGKPLPASLKTSSGAIAGFAAMSAAPLSGSTPKPAGKPQLSSTVKAALFNTAQERSLNNLRQGLTIDAYNDLQLAHVKGQEKVVKIVDRGGKKIRQVQKDIDVQDFKNFDKSVNRRYNGLVTAERRRLDLIAQQQAAAKAKQLASSNAAGKAAAAQQAANTNAAAKAAAAQQSAQAKQNYKSQQSLARKRLFGIDAAKQRRDARNARNIQRQAGIDAAKQVRDRRDFVQSPAQQRRRAGIDAAKQKRDMNVRRQYGIDAAKAKRDMLKAESRKPKAIAKKFVRLDYVDDAAKGSVGRVTKIFNKLPNIIKAPFGKVGRIFSTLFNFGPLKSGLGFIIKGFKAFAFPALKILDVILRLNKTFKIFKILIGGLGLGLIAAAVALIIPYIKAVIDYFEVFKVKTSGAVKALKQAFDNVKAAVMAIISPFQDFISSLIGGGSNGYEKMSAIANIVNKVSDFILKASEAVRDFVEKYVEPFIRKALGALKEFIGGFIDIIRAAINMKNGVEGSGEAMKEGLKRVFNGILQFVLGTVVPAIVSGFFALAKGILKIFIAIVQKSPAIFGMLIKIILKVVNLGLDLWKAFVMGVLHLWANLPKYAGMAFNKVLGVIADFSNLAIDMIATIARNVVSLGGLLSNIPGFDSVMNSVFNFVEEKVGSATVAVENFGQTVENLGSSLTDNLVGMLGGIDSALSKAVDTVQGGLDGIGDAAANAGSWLSDFIDAPLSTLEDGLSGVLDSLKNTINNSLKRFEPTPIGERIGKKITEGAKETLDGDQIFEPEMENSAEDAGAAAGQSFAEKFAEALKALEEKFVGLMQDFIRDKIKSATDELVGALERQRDAALDVFDQQLKAIDALEKAEQSLMREREFIANRKRILDERELNRQNYVRNRALAIYEGRIDDARMLDLEEQKSSMDSARSLDDLQQSRDEELRKENLEFLKDQIKAAKEEADKFFKEQIEAFKEASLEITKFAPNTIEDYQEQLNQLVALAEQFASDNADQFALTFQEMGERIASNMPNQVVGVFGENLDEMIEVARQKYGLDGLDSGIVGITVSMLDQMSETILTSNVVPSWSTMLDDIRDEIQDAGTNRIKEIIDQFGPQKVLEEAINHANEAILHEWRGTLGHIASEVEDMVGFMDPMLREILKAQTAFEMMEEAARNAANAAAAAGGTSPSNSNNSGGPTPSPSPSPLTPNTPAPASAALAASVQEALRVFLSSKLPATQVATVMNQISGAAMSVVRGFMTNTDLTVRRNIFQSALGTLSGNKNLFTEWVSSRYGAQVVYAGGGGANASGSGGAGMLLANGGYVPKFANQSVPATLHGGEFVMNAKAVKNIGMATLQTLNSMRFASPQGYGGSGSTTTINKTETTNIYVENFIGEDKWFQSMLKEYNMKHKPIAEKQANGGSRFYSTYKNNSGY